MKRSNRWTRIIGLFMLTVCLAVLAACGNVTGPGGEDAEAKAEITFTTDPASPKTGTPIKLKADVKGLSNYMDAAATVQFEIKPAGTEKRELVKAERLKKGDFEASKTFTEAGKYEIIVHFYSYELHQYQEHTIEVN